MITIVVGCANKIYISAGHNSSFLRSNVMVINMVNPPCELIAT